MAASGTVSARAKPNAAEVGLPKQIKGGCTGRGKFLSSFERILTKIRGKSQMAVTKRERKGGLDAFNTRERNDAIRRQI